MKNIMGGSGIDACHAICQDNTVVNCGNDLMGCIFHHYDPSQGGDGWCSNSITRHCGENQIPQPE